MVPGMERQEYKLDEQGVVELGHLYYGYYLATKDHKKSMEFIKSYGFNAIDILRVRHWVKQAMKKDKVKG